MGSAYRKLLPVTETFAAFLRKEHALEVPVGSWVDVHHTWDPRALAEKFQLYRVDWSISTSANVINLWAFAHGDMIRSISFDTPDQETGEEPYKWMQRGDPLPFEDKRAVARVLKRKAADAEIEGEALLEAVLGGRPHAETLLAQPKPVKTSTPKPARSKPSKSRSKQ